MGQNSIDLFISGHCCITYEPCSVPDSFSLSSRLASSVDNRCNEDYIIIESSSNLCNDRGLSHRYCERVLNAAIGQTINHKICGKLT